MFCVIQELDVKKPNKHGRPKELKSEYMQVIMDGVDYGHYYYTYSSERFERPIKKAYKISIHESYRENGKPKKKQFVLCTVNYYDIVDNYFNLYDYCDNKINTVAEKLNVDPMAIYDIVETKLEPLIAKIQGDFKQTEEYKTHKEHERITSLYAANKIQFIEKYECDKDEYDRIYNVFGELMNPEKLQEVKNQYKAKKEYEEKSRSYQRQSYKNYKSHYKSSYYNNASSTHKEEDKETLKQFYRVLSKKFHPDSNPNKDTSEQMKLLNKLKDEWKV